jgi:hypothetical protein
MSKLQRDHLMILLESMDSKMQITLEAVTGLDHKIDSVRDELKEDIAILDCKIMGLSKRVDSVEKNLSDRIDSVEKNLSDRIDSVYEELVAHRNDTELHSSQPKHSLKSVKSS